MTLLKSTVSIGATMFSLLFTGCHRGSPPVATANVVSVDAPMIEMPKGYLKWMDAHSAGAESPASQSSSGKTAGNTLSAQWPALDIYNPDGSSRFYGNTSAGNVLVIEALPQAIPPQQAANLIPLRPTLSEAVAMFPEIAKSGFTPPKETDGWYTIFAVNFPARPACAAQDAAIQKLKNRLNGTKILLIDVKLKYGD